MQLKLAIHRVTTICIGSRTVLDGGTLVVDAEELRRLLLEDPFLSRVEFEIARPGESCRAGPVFDIIEPRAKGVDSSPDFPGILGPPQTAGMGTTHVLEGAAVTVLKETGAGDSRGAPGYVLEMSGEAAAGTKYASLSHVIVIPRTRPGLPGHAQQKAYRLAGLKTAVYLARAASEQAPIS
ncbi:MAG TPA: glycine/sarcosine/betaine reductase component B subunit, partial [Candidatus Binatia bacterium]|nr:glycine/sarcosine/betaine reductase component B subunit [Candidatus Binatia bacterium]